MSESLNKELINDIIKELMNLYSLDINEANKIVIESISEAYLSEHPVVLEEDAIFAVFTDKQTKNLKFSKIKYSAKKSAEIISKISLKGNNLYLEKQKNSIAQYITEVRPYLYSSFLYTSKGLDYYLLFYDFKRQKIVKKAQGIAVTNSYKKTRFYINPANVKINPDIALFKEHRNIATINNLKDFTKDISTEIYEKISKKVWIEVEGFDAIKKTIYLYLPYRTNKQIIKHLKNRFFEIFDIYVEIVVKK